MIRRLRILNLFFALTLLLVLAGQSFHGYADYKEQLAERHCEHPSQDKANLTHTHASLKHCFVCDFTFAPYAGFEVRLAPSPLFAEQVDATRPAYVPPHASDSRQHTALRGPPLMNV